MLRTRARPRFRLGFVAVLALGCAAPPVRAGNVPASALSLSLGLEPDLLDHPSLIFQFPQAATRFEAQIVGFRTTTVDGLPFESKEPDTYFFAYTGGDELGLGGIGRTGPLGFFVLSQRAYEPAVFSQRSTVLQVGAAAQWRGLRAGAALRGSREREENARTDTGGSSVSGDGDQQIHDFLEYAFGLGVAVRGASLDVVVELPRQSFQLGTVRVSSDTTALQLSSDAGDAWSAAARLSVPFGGRFEWIAAGGYRENPLDWSGRIYDGSQLRFTHFGTTALDWSVAGALVTTTPYVDRIWVAGSYARRAVPTLNPRFNVLSVSDQRNRVAILTISASHTLRPSLSAQLSVRKQYEYLRTDSEELRTDSYLTLRTDRDERFSDQFAWGLVWDWRRFQFASSVSTTLDIENLLAALDVRFDL